MWNSLGEFVGNVSGAVKERFKRKNDFHVSHRLKGDERLPGETRSEYKKRRKREKRLLEMYRSGDVVWDSTRDGTYVESEHGSIQSFRAQ